jgi:tetratricopeptide (TPR) repeat protein
MPSDRIFLALLFFWVVSGSSPQGSSLAHVDRVLAEAYRALDAGELDQAEQLLRQIEDRHPDPGLLAYTQAGIDFQRGNFREAARGFALSLDDQLAPTARQAKAWYNRGLCLLQLATEDDLREAIRNFGQARSRLAITDPLLLDVQHNLALAKVRLLELTERQPDSPPPNAPSQQELPEYPEPPRSPMTRSAEGPNGDTGKATSGQPVKTPFPSTQPQPTTQQTAGKGNLQVLLDEARKMDLSDEDARQYLQRIADRLQRERRAAAEPGPERIHVLDW